MAKNTQQSVNGEHILKECFFSTEETQSYNINRGRPGGGAHERGRDRKAVKPKERTFPN